MNTSAFIAKRYLFSKKSTNAINIISGISMLGVLVGSAALIIILSVFNGFETLIVSLYNNFTPELKVLPAKGKTFDPATLHLDSLRKLPGMLSVTEVLEEKVLLRYGKSQFIGTVKGVSDDFLKNPNLDSTLQVGSFTLKEDNQNLAVIGASVQISLGINIRDQSALLQIYSPRHNVVSSFNPMDEFVVRYIGMSGVFSVQQDFDDMVITPISFTRDLLDEPKKISYIELNLLNKANVNQMQQQLQNKLGKNYVIKNRYQQNTSLYKLLNSEKWAIFLILTFVLIIAIFNIIGSLTMLVIDKRKDIAILTSLGAGKKLIHHVFFYEGMLISLIGCLVGMLVGLVFSLLQQKFGFITMGGTTMVQAYPVTLKPTDFLLVFTTVISISVIASGISARLSVQKLDEIKQEL
ncbi:FtsX-like permease family protein [Mucilaginibacter arboris]|uniref:FtsX-like permease family protein n=1 Tax=Mucilaginibacter arboris TaxID=2682090 RepID=A0A7K1SSK4_9SPHI|nr:FtsX-like permease family protein [Mucilaginibacter arboris]MVN20080.1 FtsX-like permease family protein [Mucilaginibacter arboris]